jgi:hypothetical protein
LGGVAVVATGERPGERDNAAVYQRVPPSHSNPRGYPCPFRNGAAIEKRLLSTRTRARGSVWERTHCLRCWPTCGQPRRRLVGSSGLVSGALALSVRATMALQVECRNVAGDVAALQALSKKRLQSDRFSLQGASGSHPGGRRFESG